MQCVSHICWYDELGPVWTALEHSSCVPGRYIGFRVKFKGIYSVPEGCFTAFSKV